MNCLKSALKKALILLLVAFTSLVMPIRAKEQLVFRAKSNTDKKIALTFDDGPHPRYTPKILDILKKYDAKATFFVIGENVRNYPDPIKRIIEEGHEIGNHSYSHNILKSKSYDSIKKEIAMTEEELKKIYEYSTSLIRPPCGTYDSVLVDVATENDMKIVLWTIDTHDWAHNSIGNIVKTVCDNIKSGDIVLFHDYISGEDNTPSALDVILPKLSSMGYEFVTVSELLQTGNS